MFQKIIAFLSPVTLYRPSRAPQWAHTGVLERAMSLITGVAVTWVPSARMACQTAVPSGSQCKCEVTPWHQGLHGCHGCMHWRSAGILTYPQGHAETHLSPLIPGLLERVVDTKSPQSSNSCQSVPTLLWKEHALIQGALIILLSDPPPPLPFATAALRTFKEKQNVERTITYN